MKRLFTSILFIAPLLFFIPVYSQQTTLTDALGKGQPFKELQDPTADTLTDWSGVAENLQASFASIDQRFAKHRIPTVDLQTEAKLAGWRGERVSAQVLLWGGRDYEDISVDRKSVV